jgi:Carboxypeptidase regulatory-like domain
MPIIHAVPLLYFLLGPKERVPGRETQKSRVLNHEFLGWALCATHVARRPGNLLTEFISIEVIMDSRKNIFRGNLAKTVCKTLSLLAVALQIATPIALKAQTAGEGTISGTVTDSTGAVVPNATVIATNLATNVATERVTSSSGAFTIAPLHPGTYSLTVEAKGFRKLKQDNLAVNALVVLGINPVLTIGETSETVEVSSAPPVLNTSNATLGLVVENDTYSNLPLQMNNAQRDPTAFGTLAPGSQGGSRLPIIGGTGNFLGQLYLDGMPAETISQQGDNRLVSLNVSVDAVDQFQVVTSTPPAEYMGAGSMNFTMKSGGLKYHGQVSDFVRNTVFDAWSFTAKAATVKNAAGATVPAPKPVEHQNEFSASFGGKVPFTKEKVFFFVAYDKFHSRKGAVPSLYTVPTSLMTSGDFTELNGNVGGGGVSGTGANNKPFLYDPTTTTCSGGSCTRQPFQAVKNGIPTYNVIPISYISPISKAMQSFLPAPTNSAVITNNYLGGYPSGFDNWLVDYRVDFDLSAKQRISTIGAMGTVNYLNNYSSGSTSVGGTSYAFGFLPPPYIGGDLANIYPKVFDIEDTYTVNSRIVNQLKYGYTRFFQNIHNATQGVKQWEAPTFGITNLPAGQAGEEFPGAGFTPSTAFGSVQTAWTGMGNAVSTQLTTPNNYAIVDNLQWLIGRHALTFGISVQWQQINNANPATFTGVLPLTYNANSTAGFSGANINTGTAASPSGYSYASYLLGAVGGTPSIVLQPISELGGRYRPIAPYVEDSFKVSQKLTLDLGLRWDYLPPYHEVNNHWTFLNPNLTNGATGTPGELQFAGNYGGPGVSCGCRTPVHTYWGNWGPRVGAAFSPDDKTVLRAGVGVVFSAAGGVGGRGGAFGGTGQTGFNPTATGPAEVTSGAASGPSFYLNNSSGFTAAGLANTSLFGPGYQYPANPTPNAAAQTQNTGFYLNGAGKFVTASGVSYADPRISGRAPEFIFFNAGIERAVTKDMTIAVNYVGNESHFLINSTSSGANARGYWSNQLNPTYLAALGGVLDSTGKTPILIAPATPANVAIVQSKVPGTSIPTFFQSAAGGSTTATIAQGLTAFPQYSGVTDTWGSNVGNFSYNSLQITLLQRMSNGLTFNINYTYSKNIGDDGTFRSGFDIPSAAISGGGQNWKQDRIERSWTTVSAPQSLHAYGVYQLPFGKGHMGGNSMVVRALASGWQLSGIYTYGSGTPMAVISSGCSPTSYPGQGACMPDINTAFIGKDARINGSYGTGPNGTVASNLGTIKYVDSTAFKSATDVSTAPFTGTTHLQQFLLGNAPRTRPFNLNNPGTQNLDASVRRSFNLPREMALIFEVDCLNTWNKVTFSNPSASWASGSTTFGTITGIANSPRDFQFAGHFNF